MRQAINWAMENLRSKKPKNPRSATYVFSSDELDATAGFRNHLEQTLRIIRDNKFPELTWEYKPVDSDNPNSTNATLTVAWGPMILPEIKDHQEAENRAISDALTAVAIEYHISQLATDYGINCISSNVSAEQSTGEKNANQR